VVLLKRCYALQSVEERERLRASLQCALEQAAQRALMADGEQVACFAAQLSADFSLRALAASTRADARRAYWRSAQGLERCALGSVVQLEADGEDVLATVARAWEQLCRRIVAEPGAKPNLYGGFAFAPEGPRDEAWAGWPGGSLTLPELLFERVSSELIRVTVCQSVAADADVVTLSSQILARLMQCTVLAQETVTSSRPIFKQLLSGADGAYRQAVSDTAMDIRAGRFTKVVLARRVDYAVSGELDYMAALERLAQDYPDSTVFLWARTEGVFMGAAPERLVLVRGQQVMIDCLAGTAPRSTDPLEDIELGESLRNSKKDRAEHQAVVNEVLLAATAFTTTMQSPGLPQLLRLANVQHLYTPLQGVLRSGNTILDAVRTLHPTPAVAGVPRDGACAIIHKREPFDRGYYAGPFGWVDSAGEGEFVVALRSALLHHDRVSLFAGGGIMGSSRPDTEWAETEWKLTLMRTALGLPVTLEGRGVRDGGVQ